MKTLHLANGMEALVDDDIHEWVSGYRWQVLEKIEVIGTSYYAYRTFYKDGQQNTVYLHRFVMNAKRGQCVDHRDGNTLDCRRSNLRMSTRSQNNANRRKSTLSTSPFKGVCRSNGTRWRAYVAKDGRMIHLGSFATAEEAAAAYDHHARILHGEFACVNFPRSGERSAI